MSKVNCIFVFNSTNKFFSTSTRLSILQVRTMLSAPFLAVVLFLEWPKITCRHSDGNIIMVTTDYHLQRIPVTYTCQLQWHPTPVLLPGKSHGWRGLEGCSPWSRQESDTTERLPFHFSLSCIGAGNGNPLQCSCLENPRDGGAWWAAVYGVAQSRTRLKWLSSSSSSSSQLQNE